MSSSSDDSSISAEGSYHDSPVLGMFQEGKRVTINNIDQEFAEQVQVPTDAQAKLLKPKYELGDLIGKGAYGVVYKAQDLENGRKVAVKFMSNILTA